MEIIHAGLNKPEGHTGTPTSYRPCYSQVMAKWKHMLVINEPRKGTGVITEESHSLLDAPYE